MVLANCFDVIKLHHFVYKIKKNELDIFVPLYLMLPLHEKHSCPSEHFTKSIFIVVVIAVNSFESIKKKLLIHWVLL